VISMNKDELPERYEALGEDDDFLAAKPLFQAEIQRKEDSDEGLQGRDAALLPSIDDEAGTAGARLVVSPLVTG
jgi:hypothetical protein